MVFCNKNIRDEYPLLDKQIKECLEYAESNSLVQWETGTHDIDGERLFVNIVEYTTTAPEERFWEAHKAYFDLHLMLRGTEQIDLNFIQNLEQKEYVPQDDFLPLEGEKNCSVVLNEGDYLLCAPADAHRTAVSFKAPCKIKKAIFKIKVN